MKGKPVVRITGCGELHISILKDKEGYPADISIVPKGGGCRTNLHAIQELCSAMFDLDMHDVVIKALKDHTCVSCHSKRSKTDKEKIKVDKSCAHAIARVIEDAMPKEPKEAKCSPSKTQKQENGSTTKGQEQPPVGKQGKEQKQHYYRTLVKFMEICGGLKWKELLKYIRWNSK